MPPTTRSQTAKRRATESFVAHTGVTKRARSVKRDPVKKPVIRDPPTFRLLSLPRELRDNIYRRVFEGGIKIGRSSPNDSYKGPSVPHVGFNLALSCKQLFLEIKESLIRSDAVTVRIRSGWTSCLAHHIIHAFLKQIPTPLSTAYYARGVRVRFEAPVLRATVYDHQSRCHPSMRFTTSFLKWNPAITDWVFETEIIAWYFNSWGQRSRTSGAKEHQAEEVAQEEVSHWQYTLNEFRRASYPGEWRCTLEKREWVVDWIMRVTIRCHKLPQSSG